MNKLTLTLKFNPLWHRWVAAEYCNIHFCKYTLRKLGVKDEFANYTLEVIRNEEEGFTKCGLSYLEEVWYWWIEGIISYHNVFFTDELDTLIHDFLKTHKGVVYFKFTKI